MSQSFSAAWLKLREAADQRARDPGLLGRLGPALAGRSELTIVDLGCGAGSNLRAVAPHLTPTQHWTLVDHDPALLGAARAELAAWADWADLSRPGLTLSKGRCRLTVAFRRADLATDLEGALGPHADLVTAAALFDLVSQAFVTGLAPAVARRGAVFYTALTYDGGEAWEPAHPADASVHAAFLAHQRGDKGFGPALGPDASPALAAAFEALGYTVRTGDSPWRLDAPADEALLAALAQGAAGAVGETGLVDGPTLDAWLAERLAPGARCTIGHADLLAQPPKPTRAG